MKLSVAFLRSAIAAMAASAVVGIVSAQLPAKDPIPTNSVYQLDVLLENENGDSIELDLFYGNPVLVTMFYTSCPHVCPLLINTIKVMEAKLSAEERARLRVLAISVDPERDTPEALKKTMQLHAVDRDRWTMVRSKPADLRTIAGMFGVRYKKLPDGEFNHSSKIILLDGKGISIAETSKLGKSDPAFLAAIQTALE
ncbi:MAG: SCO family protein [Woeseia sp.]|jgi:protein SCO1|nr:SCO family protein [Woeseia sp.]